MKIALVQFNSWLGKIEDNSARILKAAERAASSGARVAVFPELCLFGYPPMDLLERPGILEAQEQALTALRKHWPENLIGIVGALVRPKFLGKPFINGGVILSKNSTESREFGKRLLPSYDVFDDTRFFAADDKPHFLTVDGVRMRLTVCEDIWGWDWERARGGHTVNPLLSGRPDEQDLVLNLSASPFSLSKRSERHRVGRAVATHFQCPFLYVNAVGAQDEIIFDGGSFAMSPRGEAVLELPTFKEWIEIVDVAELQTLAPDQKAETQSKASDTAELIEALRLGISDFIRKTGMKRAHLGLSGGIDSSVVAALAVSALGSDSVVGVTLPGPYNDPRSRSDAEELARNLGIKCFHLPIGELYKNAVREIDGCFGSSSFGLVHENLQARLRGVFLMAYANRESSLLLGTSNKSELTVGYSTLYGDLCAGLLPIGDLLKHQVYDVAREINRQCLEKLGRPLIPNSVIERPPSAELRPNQKDSDSLPPYDDLDAAVDRLIVQRARPSTETEKWVLQASFHSEFKRWQAAPILRVSSHAFGRGRRFPLAHGWREEG